MEAVWEGVLKGVHLQRAREVGTEGHHIGMGLSDFEKALTESASCVLSGEVVQFGVVRGE
jgi:hypothetical protein